MKNVLPPHTPTIVLGNVRYHAHLAFTHRAIFAERALHRVQDFLTQFSFGVGMFFIVAAFATLVLTGEIASIGLPLFWVRGSSPAFVLLCISGLLLCYAWYRKISVLRQAPSAFLLPKGDVSPVRGVLDAGHATPLWDVTAFDARDVLSDAYLLAERFQHGAVLPVHVFAAAFSAHRVNMLFARLGISFAVVKDALLHHLQEVPKNTSITFSDFTELFVDAGMSALAAKRPRVTALDVCAAAFARDPFFVDLLAEHGVHKEHFTQTLAWLATQDYLSTRYHALQEAALLKPTKTMDRAMTAQATPFLDACTEDLTRKAAFGGMGLTLERDGEMTAVFRILEATQKSVVFVGEPGVGKMAMIEALAVAMVEERVPVLLRDKRLLRLDALRLVNVDGGKGAGERMLYAFTEARRAGNIVLVIENIHELIGTSPGALDIAALLANELEHGFFLFATTTPEAYATHIEHSLLGHACEKVFLREPEHARAMRMVQANVGFIEYEHGVLFTYAALDAAVTFSLQASFSSVLPEKALVLLREAALFAKHRGSAPVWVTREDVAKIFEEKTHIPAAALVADDKEKLLHLEERIKERVIGQEEAVRAVCAALKRSATSLRSQGRPIANFLFLGPTGVGKTELAKATAQVFFGNESLMLRFDMSEYQNADALTRLIGSAHETGLLTEAVREHPFSLVLLDELEKAHPDILNLFLQVMDDGRLTDAAGRTTDFSHVILIATSNAGATYVQDAVAQGLSSAVMKEALLTTELRTVYRPEFLNRFDDVIVFHPLTQEDVVAIAYLLCAKIVTRLAQQHITLEITDAAVHELARLGFDPKFGARPLRRVLQERVENALADALLRGEMLPRDTVVYDVSGTLRVTHAAGL